MPETLVRITLPEMGESVTQGSIVAWRKQAGDFVAEGDPLVEVTTDKVDVEVPSTVSGVIKALLAAEGDTVAVGAALAEIDTTAKTPAGTAAPPQKTAPPKMQSRAPAPPAELKPNGAVVATPQARRIARQLDVDLARVRGSGPDGLILREDVDRQAESLPPASKAAQLPQLPPLPAGAQVTPIKGPAAALASYMEQSLTIPTATSFRTMAVDTLDARRRAERIQMRGQMSVRAIRGNERHAGSNRAQHLIGCGDGRPFGSGCLRFTEF